MRNSAPAEQSAPAGQAINDPASIAQSAGAEPFLMAGDVNYESAGVGCPHDIVIIRACNDAFLAANSEAREYG